MAFLRRSDPVTIPLPYVFGPSGTFDGNDGAWSTFVINVGDNGQGSSGQNFKVLISTGGSVVTIPGQADWCTEPDQASCAEARGIEIFSAKQSLGFNPASSSSWQQMGTYNLALPADVQLYPDQRPNATYGHDTVGLGADSAASTMLASQLVAEIITEDYFMGLFGLSTTPSILANDGPVDTFLTNLNAANQTPSLTYGYTAGAKYRNYNGVLASLTFGGYDQSRFTAHGISIPMPPANNSLIVGVESITYAPDPSIESNTLSLTASTSGFLATIDSSLPYFWLPQAVCDGIADRFRLTYDKDRNLYTVNDTSHSYNIMQNATMTFTIGNGPNPSNNFASIVLPYAALDLTASFPIFDNATKYFPLKRSPTGVFVLGRAFLQEAYIIVDYERKNFTVAPATFTDPMPASHVVTIFPSSYVPPSTPPKSSGLGHGAIAGIAVACALLGVGIIAIVIWLVLRSRNRKDKTAELEQPSEIDTLAAGGEVKDRRVSELDSSPSSPPPRFSAAAGYFGDPARDAKDRAPFPPIVEIPVLNELESPPEISEMDSPPPEGATPVRDGSREYFRWADRKEPPRAIHELPGDDGRFQVQGLHFDRVGNLAHSRGHSRGTGSGTSTPGLGSPLSAVSPAPSDSATLTEGAGYSRAGSEGPTRESTVSQGPTRTATVSSAGSEQPRAGHFRDPSDVSSSPSSPTAEELEAWALGRPGIDENVNSERRGE